MSDINNLNQNLNNDLKNYEQKCRTLEDKLEQCRQKFKNNQIIYCNNFYFAKEECYKIYNMIKNN